MRGAKSHVRHGIGAVRPYLYGPSSLPEFVKQVFGAEELERHEFSPESFHVELQIGDSVLAIEVGELPDDVSPWNNAIYVYVEDSEAALQRALALGAELVSPVEDKPYAERQGGFRDVAGNTWWVSTFETELT